MYKILIVDDDKLFSSGLQLILEAMPENRVQSSSFDKYIALCEKFRPDIVLLKGHDIAGRSRFQHCTKVKQLLPSVKVAMVLDCYKEPYLLELAGVGADGYLLMDADVIEIIELVRQLQTAQVPLYNTTGNKVLLKEFSLKEKEILALKLFCNTCSMEKAAVALGLKRHNVLYCINNMLAKAGLSVSKELFVEGIRQGFASDAFKA